MATNETLLNDCIEEATARGIKLPGNLQDQIEAARAFYRLCLDDEAGAPSAARSGAAVKNALARVMLAAGEDVARDQSIDWQQFAVAICQAGAEITASNLRVAPPRIQALIGPMVFRILSEAVGMTFVDVEAEAAAQPPPVAH